MVSYWLRTLDGKMGALVGLHVVAKDDEQRVERGVYDEQSVQHNPDPPLIAASGSVIQASRMAPVGTRIFPAEATTTRRSPPPGMEILQPVDVLPL